MTRRRLHSFIGTVFLLLWGLNTLCAEITVSAEFSPAAIAVGDSAHYIIQIEESSSDERPEPGELSEISIPQPPNLTLRNGRTGISRHSSIINFNAEYSTTLRLMLEAEPQTTGEHTIPSFVISYKGENLQVPATRLTVTERPKDAVPPSNQLVKLQADFPKTLYLGQSYTAQLKLYLYEGVRLHDYGDFERNADAFTISDLTEPTQSTEMLEGHRYNVVNWPLKLTPIQSGPQELNFNLVVAVTQPQQQKQSTADPLFGGNSPFGSSLFGQMFAQAERLQLSTPPAQVEVLPLPTEGKPASFSGAIGNFNMQVYSDTEQTEMGEPITLSVQIVGTGNFSRINGPPLAADANWRSYAPDSVMKSDSANSLRGVKRFDYIMIPQQAGKIELPEVEFSYFDPETKSYVELKTPPFTIDVAESTHAHANVPALKNSAPSDSESPAPQQPDAQNESRFLSLEPAGPSGRSITTCEDLPLAFYAFNLLALLGLGCTARQLYTRRKLELDANYALRQAAHQALKKSRTRARGAAQANDLSAFYKHAQDAVRLALTYHSGHDFITAELSELETGLEKLNCPAECRQAIRQLFSQGTQLRFSPTPAEADLSAAQQQLKRILKTL